jgi:large subunit ribosomal protein L22
MKIRAEQKYSRQSPRKVRLVANQVKDLGLKEALEQLALIERKASIVLLKVMRQAIANATHNYGLQVADLQLDNILVKQGPTYKRYQAVSRGRAHKILKRTCHIEVIVSPKQSQQQPKQNKKTAINNK